MPDNQKRSTAGKIVIIILIATALIITAAIAYGAALLNGRVPVPRGALNIIASRADIPYEEREMMNKVLDVYEIIRTSEAGNDMKTLRKMVMDGTSREEAAEQLIRSYTLLSVEDMEEIRRIMEIEPEDFNQGRFILEAGMENYSRTGEFTLSDGDKERLKALAEKYGLTEEKLESWSDSYE